ncbi:hypothetical protein WDU94_005530 [Cyamophila willieti]
MEQNIDIMNRGKEPTFVTRARREVLDITLASPILATKIKNWHVSQEPSLSDHRHIRFNLEIEGYTVEETRVPKLTDWRLYQSLAESKIEELDTNIDTCDDLDKVSSDLREALITAYKSSCPLKRKLATRKVPWWNKELEKLRKLSRRLFNRAKRSGEWEQHKEALTKYNLELRKSKRRTWRSFCEGINNQPTTARLQKVLAKDHSNGLGFLLNNEGNYTENSRETLELLLSTHFPGSILPTDNNMVLQVWPTSRTKSLAGRIFCKNKVQWAIRSFKPYKSPGGDGIFPALMQRCTEAIVPILTRIFINSFIFGYIPTSWRKVNVVFIQKAGKRPSDLPKSWRPISLSSFLLKSMEKVLDLYIRGALAQRSPLHRYQFAYQKGKSTTSALHSLVQRLEKTLADKEIALVAFIDIEGAFDNTSYASIQRAAQEKGLEPQITSWITSMLQSRLTTASLGKEEVTIKSTRGCPQGGVLSPLLWSMVVDNLLNLLTTSGYEVIGYADDVVILIRGKYEEVISDLMQNALNQILSWCQTNGLNINPSKTTIVPFTRRHRPNIKAPTLGGTIIEFSKEVKYLGVTLDSKLNWNPHLKKISKKAIAASWTCRRLFGTTWGLKPHMIHWSYMAIIRPMVTYASLVWWPKTKEKTAQAVIQKIQRLACISITGAIKTCPTAAMETMLDMLPLYMHIKKDAMQSALRLSMTKHFKPGNLVGHLSILKEIPWDPMATTVSDSMPTKFNFDFPFKINIPNRDVWEKGGPEYQTHSINWYTDASKLNSKTGVGVYGPNCKARKALRKFPTVYQGEVYAILFCAQLNLRKGLKGARINISSDSQAAIKALSSFTHESKLTWECLETLKLLAKDNHVTLTWVPGHEGIDGNEKADELAKIGTTLPFIGPEPFCGVSTSHL